MPRRTTWLAMFLASASGALAAVPPYPTIELQARSNIVDGFNLPPTSSFNSKTPTLNDAATIAFTLIAVGGGNPGLFVGGGGVGSVVYSAPAGRVLSDPSINNVGSVAFDQSDLLSDGVFVFDPVSMETTLAVPPTDFDFSAGLRITDSGRIGFRAGLLGGIRSWRLYDQGFPTTYVAEGGAVAYLFTASVDNQQRIAGKVRLGSTSGSAPDEIRVYDGPGSFVAVAVDRDADAQSPYSGFDNSVHLADDGRVAFIADLFVGGRGVFLTDGTDTTTIATVADPDVSGISFFSPAANSSGLVAFRGTDGAGLDAIFVGDGIELRRVVGEHDLVATDLGTARIDQHDNSVVFGGGVAIDSQGDVAFNAALTPEHDDQIEWGSGMFVAYATSSPPPVPDGKVAGDAMTVGRRRETGDLIVRWDSTTCPASDYNLFYGDLALVASHAIAGAECSLGTGGVTLFSTPPGDLFFLVASENATGVESGHGLASDGEPRSSNGVGLCGITEQSLEGVCR